MDFIEIENLWVKYRNFVAVKELSFTIPKGEVFGFIGPNGAGKTSTIRVLATLLKPAWGRVIVGGHDIVRDPFAVRRIIGYMPDFFGVYDDLTVTEYLAFFAAAYRVDTARRSTVIRDVLELTDLGVKHDAPVEGLSRGMKQRLNIARILLHDPQFLLLDEPTSGLDPRARIEMRELFKELRGMGKTILISSHILSELGPICTRIGIIETGKLVAAGPLDAIIRHLRLKRTVHVQISNLDEPLRVRIAAIPGVHRVEHIADRLVLEIGEEQLSVEDLLDRIRATGARVWMFQPDAIDLETVFMKLTEGRVA